MSLPNVQADLVEALLSKDSQSDLLMPAGNLAIYRNNMYASLIDALQNTYPLIQSLLGNDFFRMAAKEYIQQYPSRSGNLYEYGEYFADFLAEYQPVHHLIYLTEVAEFEWACHIVYLAADHPAFDIKSLQHHTPEEYDQLRFVLHPASYLRKFHFPILEILDLCINNPEAIVDLSHEGNNLLIIRKELELSLNSLPQEDFVFLEALSENRTLSAALQCAQQCDPYYNLEEKLPGFIQSKLIVDCYLSDKRDETEITL